MNLHKFFFCILLLFSILTINAQTTVFSESFGQSTARTTTMYMPTGPNCFIFADPAMVDNAATTSYDEAYNSKDLENNYYSVVAPSCIYTSVSASFVPGYRIWNTTVADHTGDVNGAALVVNAGTTLNSFYKRPVTLTAGKYYRISFYYYVVNSTVNIGLKIISPTGNSTLKLISTGDLGGSSGWTKFSTDIFLPAGCTSGTYYLSLENLKELNSGNDFMVDDILFQQITTSSTFGTLTCPGAEPTATNDSKQNQTIGTTITIDPFTNDKLANGSTVATFDNSTITLLAPQGGALTSIWYGYSIVVPNEGEWKYSTQSWDANKGKLQFVPNSNFKVNPTPIYYTLTDNSTGTSSSLATVNITYSGCPIAVADVATSTVGATANVALLANDKMTDGITTPTSATVSVTLIAPTRGTSTGTSVTMPSEGTWVYSSGNLSFVPLSLFTGNPTPISYQITEGNYVSAPATVTITTTANVTTKPAVVIIDNIVPPTGVYKTGDIVQFTFDLHNMGPFSTINPITINYKLPVGLAFVSSGSSAIFSQSGTVVSGVQNAVMAVGSKQSYILRLQIQGAACPAKTVGADPLGCTGDGFLTIAGGAELSPGYMRWREWSTWGTGGRENYVDERPSLYFPVGQDTPISSTTGSPANKGTAPAADKDYYYDKTHTGLYAGVITNSGAGTRRTWEWYGIVVPDETTDYTFCGSQIDDGWVAWINNDWNPQAGQSMDPSQMILIGENYNYQAGTNISTPNFKLTCGRPYFFRIIVTSRNGGADGQPYGYSNIALRKVSQSTCTQKWAAMVGESINIPLRININCPPTVKNDAVTAEESTIYNGNIFVNNGSGADYDINDDTYTVTKINGVITNVGAQILLDKGALTVNTNGTFSFDPKGKYEYLAAGQTAVLTFTYNATDARGLESDLATVQLTITGTNDLPVTADDAITTDEDKPVTSNITANDADVDGTIDVATVDLDPVKTGRQTSYTIAGQGTYTVDDLGVLTFTPLANYNGTATPIKYNVKDDSGAISNVATISVNVVSVNDLPAAVADNMTTDEDISKSGTLSTNDTPSGDGGNVWSKVTDPAHGTALVSADGTFSYIPALNYNGSDSFTYKITDVDGDASTAIVSITVVSVNDTPTALPDILSINENTIKSGTLASNDTPSGDGGNVWTKVSNPVHGTALVNTDGTYTYTPALNYNGSDNFTYKITDADGDASTATVSITVVSVNDLPIAVVDNVSINEDTSLSGTLAANDIPSGDGGNIWSKVSNSTHGTVVVNADGTYTYTPIANYNGSDSFTYKITDVDGDASTAIVNVTVVSVNDLPIAVVDNVSINEDTSLSGTLAANDIPSGDGGNIWSKVSNPTHGTVVVNADGTYTYTPIANYNGSDSFTYKITDVDGDASTTTVNVTVVSVNDLPVAVADNVSTNEDSPKSGTLAGNDTPSGDGGNVWAKVSNPTRGTVVVNVDGTYIYTPVANYNGSDNFTYKITDADGDVSTATVSIAVVSVNNVPVAVADNVTTNEDSSKSGTLAGNDTPSGDGGNLWAKVSNPTHGTVVVNADGTYAYTPVANYNGSDSFTYKITDVDGDVSTATVSITVVSVNDLPVAVADNVSTNEDSPKSGTLATNDTPSGDGGNVWAKVSNPTRGTVIVNADGTYTYTPIANYNGSDNFTYKITDVDGDASTATVNITVVSVNDLPVAVADNVATNEDSPKNGTLAGNDTPSGDGGNVWTKVTDPVHGTVVVNADGTYAYTPVANYNGSDSFTYKITDADGDVSTSTVSISVASVNDFPVAVADNISTNEDNPKSGTLATNDTPSGDGGNVWTKVTDPVHGTAVVNADGSYTYTPVANYNGSDSFDYKIIDGDGDASTSTVSITVASVNDFPLAAADNVTTNEDNSKSGTLATNDTPSGDGGNVWAKVTDPVHGTIMVNADGSYIYTPVANYNGSDSFTYKMTDADGDVSTATVNITIISVNDVPVSVDDIIVTNEDTPQSGNLASNDTMSGDGGNVGFVLTYPIHGNLSIVADGSYTYTPAANYHGSDSFMYKVTDFDGDASTATVTITVVSVNDLPIAAADNVSTQEDTALSGTLAGNDTPSGDGGNVWTMLTSPTHGSATVNSDGTYTYTPSLTYSGIDNFSYSITDVDGDISIGTVKILVSNVNFLPVAADDYVTTNEDVTFSGNLATNDTQSGDGGNVWAKVSNPSHGTATINSDGTFTYTPEANYNGLDQFTYTLTDVDNDQSTAKVILTVVSVNDLPGAVADNISTNEDTQVSGSLATNDLPSGDGGNIWIKETNPTHGALVVNADGTYTYTPSLNYNGSDSFTYTIIDANEDRSTATATVIVNSINDLPLTTDDVATTNEDAGITISVLSNDVDVDGDMLTVTSTTTPAHGTVMINANGTVTYTPNINYSGIDTYNYTVSDGNGGINTAFVTITVTSVNNAPHAVSDVKITNEDTPVVITVLSNDTDVEGDPLSVTGTTSPTNGTVFVNADGTINYTPTSNYNGPDAFDYTISDGIGGSSTATVTVTVTSVNDVPQAVNDAKSTNEDVPVIISVLSNDIDVDGDVLTITSTTVPTHGSVIVNADKTISYTPIANFYGIDAFNYTINDGNGGVSTAMVTVIVASVNDSPQAVNDAITTDEDSPVIIYVVNNDTDVDGDVLTVTSATTPAHGTVVINTNLTITYIPVANYNGSDTFDYTVSDGNGGTSTATVTIAITAVNDAPQALNDIQSTSEDTPVVISVLSNDTDVDGDVLTVTNTIAPAHGSLLINADKTINYTPLANFYGSDTFDYTISDGNGGTSSATVTVTVTSVNDAPQAANDVKTTDEDIPTIISVLSNDTDVEGDALTVTSTTLPAHGTVVVNADGTLIYSPAANFHGTDTFDYTIGDGNGGSNTATVTVTVNSINDVPLTIADVATTNEDTVITIPVLMNDIDVDGDVLMVTSVTTPAHGTVIVNVDGTVTYTPNANFYGLDTFNYTVNDGNGGTSTATVMVTVTSVNDAPLAVADLQSTLEDNPVIITVLTNDTDVETDVLNVTGVTPPLNGTVVVNADKTVTYTPYLNFHGTDTFKYTITDGNGGNSTALVTINVITVNDFPTAVNDIVTVDEDTPIVISVLSNDMDVDEDAIILTGVTVPANGLLTVRLDGSIIYIPNKDFHGTDTFDYSVSDGNGGTSTAKVTIVVKSVNDAPLAVNDAIVTDEDTPVKILPLTNDIDVDADVLSIVNVNHPIHGAVVVNINGEIIYTPDPNFNGTDAFDYTITDGNGGSSTATVNIIINSVNDLPLAINDSRSVEENTQVVIPVLSNDTDPEGDLLKVTTIGNPVNGEIYVNSDGLVTYIPNGDFHGSETVNYNVTDGNGGISNATITVTVFKVNKPPLAKNDTRITKMNTPADILVLSNDIDLDGDVLTITDVTLPVNGNVAINSNGTITYTPNVDFIGTDAFYYTITDGYAVNTAKVNVTIEQTTIQLPKVWKKTSVPELNSDGTFSWTYTITIFNDTNRDIDSIQIVDNLDTVFKSKGCTYEVTSIVAYGTLWANGLYNGSNKVETLISDSSYVRSNSLNSIVIKLKVNNHNYVGDVFNQASLVGHISYINYHIPGILSDDVSFSGLADPTVTNIPDIELLIPDGFSPNDDDFNQTFVIKHSEFTRLNLKVYNRWGNIVYENLDYKNEWNGKGTGNFMGKDLPTGTYYCICKLIDTATGKIISNGVKYITLRR
jgi:large repetitive protein